MEISLEKRYGNKIIFAIKGIPTSFANVIRRYAMVHIPIIAADNVTFYENVTSMFDEYIAHRIGLIPVHTPEKIAEKTEIIFTLDETGPKMIYSKDFKSSDSEIIFVPDDIPLLTLFQNQHIRLEAKARVGNGMEHAKFQAGLISYEIIENKDSKEGKSYRFKTESFYHMEPHEVIQRGMSILEDDIGDLIKGIEKAKK